MTLVGHVNKAIVNGYEKIKEALADISQQQFSATNKDTKIVLYSAVGALKCLKSIVDFKRAKLNEYEDEYIQTQSSLKNVRRNPLDYAKSIDV